MRKAIAIVLIISSMFVLWSCGNIDNANTGESFPVSTGSGTVTVPSEKETPVAESSAATEPTSSNSEEKVPEIRKRLKEFEDTTRLLNYKGDDITLINSDNLYDSMNPFGMDGAAVTEFFHSSEESNSVSEDQINAVKIGTDLETLYSALGSPLYSCIWSADRFDDEYVMFAYEIHMLYLTETGMILDIGLDQAFDLYGLLTTPRSILYRRVCTSGYRVCSMTEYSFDELAEYYSAHSIEDRITYVRVQFYYHLAFSNEPGNDSHYTFDKENRVHDDEYYSLLIPDDIKR